TEASGDAFRDDMKEAVRKYGRDELRDDVWDRLAEGMRWVTTDFADEGGEDHLAQVLNEVDGERGTQGNRIYYLAVPPGASETIGIEGRADYYERAGAIRDIFQNHLLQLLAITAMEPPIDFTADSVRNEKVKVLKALHTPGPKSVVRGQYGRGFVEGEEVPGYREERGVDPSSTTDTYVAAKLYVDNWRWADTPFYVRMGKRLARRETTIAMRSEE